MLFAINDKLALSVADAGDAVGYSKVFSPGDFDNRGEITFVIIIASGEGATIRLDLEASNDEQSWTSIQTIGPSAIFTGYAAGLTLALSARTYRIKWTLHVDDDGGACILAANVETTHA
jgi:hypothetical protein